MLSHRVSSTTAAAKSSRRSAVRVAAISRSEHSIAGVASKLASAALAVTLITSAPAQAAQLNTLADVMRPQFEFVDANKDGVVSLKELEQLSSQVSEEEGMAQPSEAQLSFTLRLFDLNQDGQLTTDEMLTSLALDAVVSEDAVDADAVKVFDKNNDGLVERSDWSGPLGDMGSNGEVVKGYIYERVDHLYDGNGKLDATELGNALTLVRTLALGY